jgi:hypothetical protein
MFIEDILLGLFCKSVKWIFSLIDLDNVKNGSGLSSFFVAFGFLCTIALGLIIALSINMG